MNKPSPYDRLPSHLADSAIDLSEFDVHELAWSRSDALAVIEHLVSWEMPILGGDVLSSVNPLTYAYANWHSDQRADEDIAAYARRSQHEARDYIGRYPTGPAWFVLVVGKAGLSKRSPNER
jgi:Immunity protein 40